MAVASDIGGTAPVPESYQERVATLSVRQLMWLRFKRNRLAVVGGVFLNQKAEVGAGMDLGEQGVGLLNGGGGIRRIGHKAQQNVPGAKAVSGLFFDLDQMKAERRTYHTGDPAGFEFHGRRFEFRDQVSRAEPAQLAEADRPSEQEDDLDVEDHEQHRH